MEEQNFKNHSRLIPVFHFIGYFLVGSVIGISIIKLYKSYLYDVRWLWLPTTFFLIGLALLLLFWYSRSFALKAQDRAIRAEENLRYFAMTGNLLDNKLTMRQIIALRFAPNNEFPDLAHRAVKENMTAKDIKKAIKNWKADYDRV